MYSDWLEDQGNGDDFGASDQQRRERGDRRDARRRRRSRKKLVRRRSRGTADRDERDDGPRRRRRGGRKMRKVRRKKRMPDGRIIEVIELVEDISEEAEPEEFPVDEELESAIDEAEAAPDDEGAVEELGAVLRDGWGQVSRISANLRIQPKAGLRAAVMELKPGLYIVAEVPDRALQERDDFGGPIKMATKITQAVKDALDHPQQNQVGAWRERAIERKCRCRWEQE